ncbi:hypothetical protein C4N9_05905 [Pararhodobacter marinus]|uniref:Peptidase S1 n=1 Tax=Pararhodobacter marinus TaxID=2184063 RepID=A0A2U2CEE9_9RHOB|nr:hypothetical protein [Pararhodobacter marinus]PWE30230.1 hypothetical protein C4N9_05905 [Pararhodobacter marinus]
MTPLFRNTFAAALIVSLPAFAQAMCPSYQQSGAALSYDAEQAYVPQSTTVIAGGDLDLSSCAEIPGTGYVIENPDFTMQYDALGMGRALEIRVDGDCDTVLLVNTASGEWLFNDDAMEMNPALRIENAASGQYDIWVGTYGTETCEATMTVETF